MAIRGRSIPKRPVIGRMQTASVGLARIARYSFIGKPVNTGRPKARAFIGRPVLPPLFVPSPSTPSTVTAGIPIRLDIMAWEVPFTSSRTPPIDIRVCVNGAVVNQYTLNGTSDSVRVQCQPGEGIALEILDSEDAILSPAFPGRLTLNWTAVAAAKTYRVEEYVAAVWTARQTIVARGETAFSWETRWLENQTTFQFRVIPITAGGTEGTALAYSALMVRHDAVPAVTYTYAAGTGKVTVAAAA